MCVVTTLGLNILLIPGVLAFQANGSTSSLPPVYSLLANIQIAHARKSPKLILQDASEDTPYIVHFP